MDLMPKQSPEKIVVISKAWVTAAKWVRGNEPECVLELESDSAVLKQLNSRHTEYFQARVRYFQGSIVNRRAALINLDPSFSKPLKEEAFLTLEMADSEVILNGRHSQVVLPVLNGATQLPSVSVNLENRLVVKTKQLVAAVKSLNTFRQNPVIEVNETGLAFRARKDNSETRLAVKPLLIRTKQPCSKTFDLHDLNEVVNRLPKDEGFVELFLSQSKPLEIQLSNGPTSLSAYLAPIIAEE
jgi:hypothetical protein